MVPLQVAVLPQSSVAVQVLVTAYSAGHAPGVVTSSKVIITEASQASVAVANQNLVSKDNQWYHLESQDR
jgi:hypothetical protein